MNQFDQQYFHSTDFRFRDLLLFEMPRKAGINFSRLVYVLRIHECNRSLIVNGRAERCSDCSMREEQDGNNSCHGMCKLAPGGTME